MGIFFLVHHRECKTKRFVEIKINSSLVKAVSFKRKLLVSPDTFPECQGQSKVYFITWLVQIVTGQLLLLSLSEVGQNMFEANINGTEAFYELKMKFEMENVSFEDKVVNHASREMFGRIHILDGTKFPCQLFASVIF